MSLHTDIQTWLSIKQLIRIHISNNINYVEINKDEFDLTFDMDHIRIRLSDKTVSINYSSHFICDIERVFELLACNLNEDFVNQPCGYIWLDKCEIGDSISIKTNEEKFKYLESISLDHILCLIVPYITQFKRCNELHWEMENETLSNDLKKITKRYLNISKASSISYMDLMGYCGDGLFIKSLLEYPTMKESVSSLEIEPSLKIFYLELNDKDNKYFTSDLLNMSDNKLRYVIDGIKREYFGYINPLIFSYIKYIKDSHTALNKIRTRRKISGEIYNNIIKSIPNHIDKFPFTVFPNDIPSLTTLPKSNFNWLLTKLGNSRFDYNVLFRIGNMKYKKESSSDIIRFTTDALLPYINCPEKVLELYCDYITRDQEDTNAEDLFDEILDYIDEIAGKNLVDYMNLAIEREFYTVPDGEQSNLMDFNVNGILNFLNGMLKFIDDGADLYETYSDIVEIENGEPVKLVPVEGTLLKQMRNSIYNHREEKKISIEAKLKSLKEGEMMECGVLIPSVIKPYHIYSKKYLIFSGKELGHCIGGKTNSTNIFVRKGSVCAEITYNKETFIVSTCLDANNKITDDSKEFEAFLTKSLEGLTPEFKESSEDEVQEEITQVERVEQAELEII